jgi:hypothetical protein
MIGGAVRRYLDLLDELPEASLVAVMPVSIRAGAGTDGNRLIYLPVPLGTDQSDPVERLRAVAASGAELKEATRAVGAER